MLFRSIVEHSIKIKHNHNHHMFEIRDVKVQHTSFYSVLLKHITFTDV